VPIYREISSIKRLNTKISIQGFENSDTIPFEKLFGQMKFVLNDSSSRALIGELYFSRNGATHTITFGKQFADSCTCKGSFDFVKSRFRKRKKGDVLFFWNVQLLKGGINYTLPSRVYNLK
jgi:hypothetical protein